MVESTAGIAVFAPVTILTITLERAGEHEEVHVHPGGQGVWQARMAGTLGVPVTLCTLLGGEPGSVLDGLLTEERIEHPLVEMGAASPTWIQDRRDGERVSIWESPPFSIGRHELDELFSVTLAAALRAGVCVVAGTHEGIGALDPDTYRRLVSDLRAAGVSVVVDLTGDELACALAGEPDIVKVSDEDMRRESLLEDDGDGALERLVAELHGRGAGRVVVSRAESRAVASDGARIVELDVPRLDVADARGAGDSMTAALGVGLARGLGWAETLRLASAAGAVNVTRHGSGSGRADAITELAELVRIDGAVDR
jgi:1-phosphofructokinase